MPLEQIAFTDIKKGDRLKIGVQKRNWQVFDRYATAMQDALVTGWYAEHPDSQYVNVRFDDPKRPYNDAPYKDSPHPNDTLYGPYHRALLFQIDERGGSKGETWWTSIYKITEEVMTTQIEQAQADIKAAENLLRNAQDNLAKATATVPTQREDFIEKLRGLPTGSLITFGASVVYLKRYGTGNSFIKDTGTQASANELYTMGYRADRLNVLYRNVN
jgi:hypothetical protein